MTLRTKVVMLSDGRRIEVHELSMIGKMELASKPFSFAAAAKQMMSDNDFRYLESIQGNKDELNILVDALSEMLPKKMETLEPADPK